MTKRITVNLHGETDATKWADEFMRVIFNHDVTVDRELMVGWFANAIESGREAERKS
jgi:hypothetical protein